ncbi:hypothetical protein CHLRE_07g342250v5 [Chlamydomonas reinhardtii]|uniref:Prefoldin subunit 2 n=1 Tax=Chlamydomonas reinhardtii TaxID=3055 RepID=A0A2K3DKL0_CHLRE|nr:uncharacterized protein CHLRE_07g342250v5 [Chlamydomonas reinhardtii]PNW81072.1 hypothetical protein CHLRE_07g342250v5 [Chlamydomonas reinhardtii]
MSSGPRNENEVLQEFQARRERIQVTWTKIMELGAEATEHQLVMDALQKLDKDRKCFRLVGDVLVERTVGETVPAVLKNRDNLKSTIESFQKQLDIQKKELAEFQEKYKIRVRSESDVAAEEAAAARAKEGAKAAAAQQGVLVSKS